MQANYYFLGSALENNEQKLYCFKTDINGNVLLKKNTHILLSADFSYAKEGNNHIVIADGNRLLKLDANLELLWMKTYPGIGKIKTIKTSKNGKYIFSTEESIYPTDTAGTLLPSVINYSYILRDFTMLHDTLYILQNTEANNSTGNKIVLQKRDSFGHLIKEKIVDEFPGLRIQLLVASEEENKCVVFSQVSYQNQTSISALEVDKNFNVFSHTIKAFPNLWVTLYRYQQHSLFIGGDYDAKGVTYDSRLVQMDHQLGIKLDYGSNDGYYNDLYITDDGYILTTYCSSFIKKMKGEKFTSTENVEKHQELTFYPNPFTNYTNVSFQLSKQVEFNVYDAQGKRVFQQSFNYVYQLQLNDGDLPGKGLYFYTIRADKEVYKGKILH